MKADADARELAFREKFVAQEARSESMERVQEKMIATRSGLYRVLLAVSAAKVDPTKLDAIMEDLRVIPEGISAERPDQGNPCKTRVM